MRAVLVALAVFLLPGAIASCSPGLTAPAPAHPAPRVDSDPGGSLDDTIQATPTPAVPAPPTDSFAAPGFTVETSRPGESYECKLGLVPTGDGCKPIDLTGAVNDWRKCGKGLVSVAVDPTERVLAWECEKPDGPGTADGGTYYSAKHYKD